MSGTNASVPPLVSNSVLAISASITINAPREKVWSILLDFRSYNEWNSFVRNQQLVDGPALRPLPDQTPRPSTYLYISPVHIPPTFSASPSFFQKQSALTYITTIDDVNFRAAWSNRAMPRGLGFLLNGERWQLLTEVEGGKTRYETVEVFNGVLAYIIKWLLKRKLTDGFEAMAEGLKKRAEEV